MIRNNLDAVNVFAVSIVVLFGLIWIGILIFLRRAKKKSSVFLLFFSIFYIYVYKILDLTLLQYQSLVILKYFTPNLMLNGQSSGNSVNLIPLVTLTRADLRTSLLNILLMLPFGFWLPFITPLRMKKVIIASTLLSLTIELLQLISGWLTSITFRIADINDIVFNTIGAAVGYLLFLGCMVVFRRVFQNWKTVSNPILHYIATISRGMNDEGRDPTVNEV